MHVQDVEMLVRAAPHIQHFQPLGPDTQDQYSLGDSYLQDSLGVLPGHNPHFLIESFISETSIQHSASVIHAKEARKFSVQSALHLWLDVSACPAGELMTGTKGSSEPALFLRHDDRL